MLSAEPGAAQGAPCAFPKPHIPEPTQDGAMWPQPLQPRAQHAVTADAQPLLPPPLERLLQEEEGRSFLTPTSSAVPRQRPGARQGCHLCAPRAADSCLPELGETQPSSDSVPQPAQTALKPNPPHPQLVPSRAQEAERLQPPFPRAMRLPEHRLPQPDSQHMRPDRLIPLQGSHNITP